MLPLPGVRGEFSYARYEGSERVWNLFEQEATFGLFLSGRRY